MAKKSAIEKNKRREKLAKSQFNKRQKLREMSRDLTLPAEERIKAVIKLSELPRNGALIRVRNRCELTGRSRGVYRKFKLSRIALRDLASDGFIPGMTKASW